MNNEHTVKMDCIRVPMRTSVSEWATTHHFLQRTSAYFKYDKHPYMIEPSDAFSDIAGTWGVAICVPSQTGKDLAWDTPIPTTDGFKTMEDLSVGDVVYSMDGTHTRVEYKTPPQWNKMYRVEFDDGTWLDAGEDHRWLASESDCNQHRMPEKVYTTREMVEKMAFRATQKTWVCRGKLRSVFAIRMPDPVRNCTADLPIDPYVLGAWLGDGNKSDGRITKSAEDLREMFPDLPPKYYPSSSCPDVNVPGLRQALSKLGLLGNKRIPSMYLYASVDQRLALLQGLMDTDGTADAHGKSIASWSQKSDALTDDFMRLLWSLGIKAHRRKRTSRIKALGFTGEYNEVTFSTELPVFRLSRKASRMRPTVRRDAHWRYIRSIKPIPTVRSYCISVSHPSHTYLAGKQYCVTHNTTLMQNALGWVCEYDRQNVLIVFDTLENGQRFSRNRLKPFLRDTCGILNNSLEANPDKSNSAMNISLGTGANVFIGTGKSPSQLASTPAKYLLMDEIDRWTDQIEGEGDPVSLALQRQMTYRGMALFTSTPTMKETSRIWKQFLLGTQCVWGVYCDSCGKHFSLEWTDIDWTEPDNPVCHCPHCGEVWTEQEIIAMRHGYEAQNEHPQTDKYGRILRSYSVNGLLCHAQYTWASLKEYERSALQTGEAAVQSFRNTRLAECYTPPDEIRVDAQTLMIKSLMRFSDDCIPTDIAYITCGVDTHDACLYAAVYGWSADCSRCYGLTYHVLAGDPDTAQPWEALTELTNRPFIRKDGRILRCAFTFCDAGGHRTNSVLAYTFHNSRFFPIKGFASTGKATTTDPLLRRVFKMNLNAGIKTKIQVMEIGVNNAKDMILKMETLTLAGEPALNFATKNCFGNDFFVSLTSEVRIQNKWVAPAKKWRGNEALDTLTYALACAVWYRRTYYDTGKDRETREWKMVTDLSDKEIEAMKNEMDKPIEEAVEEKKEAVKAKRGGRKKAEKPKPVEMPEPISNEGVPQKKYRRM